MDFWRQGVDRASLDMLTLFFKQNPSLSSLEKESFTKLDLHIADQPNGFSASSMALASTILHFFDSVKLKSIFLVSAITKKSLDGCQVLVLCSSALRCIEVLELFARSGLQQRATKLFGKHIKIDDQIKALRDRKWPLAVGTPARVLAIHEQQPELLTGSLKALIIDANRDIKRRSIFDIPETAKPLFDLIYRRFTQLSQRNSRLQIYFME